MDPIIIRFATLYSPELMERLAFNRINGGLTKEDAEQAYQLWNLCDSMVSTDLVNLKSIATAIHVASLDEETGYFEPEHLQSLTLYIANQLDQINFLRSEGDDALSAVKEYEKQQLIEGGE